MTRGSCFKRIVTKRKPEKLPKLVSRSVRAPNPNSNVDIKEWNSKTVLVR